MSIQQLQTWVEANWSTQSKQRPDIELQLLYILEELGEVSEAIRKQRGLKQRTANTTNLGSELADLLVSIVTLANHFDIDLDKELGLFRKRLTERQKKGY